MRDKETTQQPTKQTTNKAGTMRDDNTARGKDAMRGEAADDIFGVDCIV
jgi:hypothetical protein